MGGACPTRRLACGHGFHHACIQEWLLRKASCPLCKTATGDQAETCSADSQPFLINLGHQEMAQFVHELEDIFRAIHAGIGTDYPIAISGLAYNLCTSLGYEDEDELEEALGGRLVEFLEALPHFEVRWPEGREGETADEPRAIMRPEPSEDDTSGPGVHLVFTVSEREHLWRILMQGPVAEVEIPEIEFGIRPKAQRRIDTIYNMIASAVFHLGDHVQKNKRMGGTMSENEINRIAETIDQLNALLDLEQPFTVVVKDPQGVSELKPRAGVSVSTYVRTAESTDA
eukprot:TRINITY_DN65823_c0_g1_i1.p1 TRINITY_DN65823_c0_g1~~TRINITY_DN65823_c0_g1_i1.p1  ORF type:complete len:333 (-),score=60.07 TRINITY_DN65823_c0_g1_i1:46-903(-)